MKFEKFLQTHKIFIFAGNGGTGKTTLSAAWALEAVQSGKNVGLITIDPSRRLGEVFSMDIGREDYKRLSFGDNYLDVHLIQSEKIIKDFIEKNFSTQKYQELSKNRLFKQISTHLAENQSISTIYYLAQMIQSQSYDCIVVDTPPANHAVDFFRSPAGTLKIFKENILAKAIFEPTSVKSWSSQKIFKSVLSYLVGDEFVKEIEMFFSSLFSFQQQIVQSAEFLQKKLVQPEVCYFLVTLPQIEKVDEVTQLIRDLGEQGIRVEHWFINRAHPDWLSPNEPRLLFTAESVELKKYYDKLYDYYHNHLKRIQDWAKTHQKEMHVYFVPEKNFFDKDFRIQDVQESLLGALT